MGKRVAEILQLGDARIRSSGEVWCAPQVRARLFNLLHQRLPLVPVRYQLGAEKVEPCLDLEGEQSQAGAGVPLLDEDYLILSTIHSAKGQEWKSVFVLNVVDGCIPSDLGTGASEEIEEERRLLYVAMTRAKDDLHLVVPQRVFTHGQNAQGDRHVHASRTRFIPDELLGLFEGTVWPSILAGSTPRDPSHGVRIDVAARMRGMGR